MALAAYALSSHFLDRNLHGRYLVGLYIAAILAGWTVPLLSRDGSRVPIVALIFGAVIAIHAYALPFVLLRYF